MKNPIEAIKQRTSCRTYVAQMLAPSDKEAIESILKKYNIGLFGEEINFILLEKDTECRQEMKITYGLISNHRSYILAKTKKDSNSRMSYGYLLEKIVLEATAMQLGTCWIGVFDEAYFPEVDLSPEVSIPSLLFVGYAAQKKKFVEKVARFAVGASKRKDWDALFFKKDMNTALQPDQAGPYAESLNMLRLAPSAGNSQPWRVLMEDEGVFHFYRKTVSLKYQEIGLHDVDLGIALSHFELTSVYNGLKGSWVQNPNVNPHNHDNMDYMISWIAEK